jgi:hypothetical protein
MRGIIRGTGPAGLLAAAVTAALAGALAAGCTAAGRVPYRATGQTCYAFGVQALERHITVTTGPRACAGLSHAQVNEAVARAVRDVAGARHRAAARRIAQREGRYLAQLISTVPPSRPAPLAGPAPLAAAPARPSADSPVSLAALAAWVLTAAAGSYLLAGWLRPGGLRRRTRAAGVPPAVIVSHFALAVAGLGTWIAFVATELAVLAWIAVGLLLLIAGLGMATLVTGLPEPAAADGPAGHGPQLAMRMAGAATAGTATARAATAEEAVPGGPRAPVTVIAAHGVLAAATILLVLLAAIGAA